MTQYTFCHINLQIFKIIIVYDKLELSYGFLVVLVFLSYCFRVYVNHELLYFDWINYTRPGNKFKSRNKTI